MKRQQVILDYERVLVSQEGVFWKYCYRRLHKQHLGSMEIPLVKRILVRATHSLIYRLSEDELSEGYRGSCNL